MNETGKQFSFTRAASSTSGRAKNQIPISSFLRNGLLLTLCIAGLPAALYSTTFKFKSGATFEGEVLGFKDTNSAVIGSVKDGKPYTLKLTMLDDATQKELAQFKARRVREVAARENGPWNKDPVWLSNQEAIYAFKAKAVLVNYN